MTRGKERFAISVGRLKTFRNKRMEIEVRKKKHVKELWLLMVVSYNNGGFTCRFLFGPDSTGSLTLLELRSCLMR